MNCSYYWGKGEEGGGYLCRVDVAEMAAMATMAEAACGHGSTKIGRYV